jgi:hypothetical protein
VKGGLQPQFGGHIAFAADDTLYTVLEGDILKVASNGDSVRLGAKLPGGVRDFTLAANDDVFVVDHTTNAVLKVAQDGRVSTFASTAELFRSSNYQRGDGIVLDRGGNLYVADSNYHVVRRITPGGRVSTLAGLSGVAGKTDGRGGAAQFEGPSSQIVVDSRGTVYVVDVGNRLRKISPRGRVSTIDAQRWLDQFGIDRR